MDIIENKLKMIPVIKKKLCDKCGKEINVIREDYFHGEKLWEYNSNKEGRRDKFDLCENCYDNIVAEFKLFSTQQKL